MSLEKDIEKYLEKKYGCAINGFDLTVYGASLNLEGVIADFIRQRVPSEEDIENKVESFIEKDISLRQETSRKVCRISIQARLREISSTGR